MWLASFVLDPSLALNVEISMTIPLMKLTVDVATFGVLAAIRWAGVVAGWWDCVCRGDIEQLRHYGGAGVFAPAAHFQRSQVGSPCVRRLRGFAMNVASLILVEAMAFSSVVIVDE